MSYTQALSQVSSIYDQIASLQTAFAPPATSTATTSDADATALSGLQSTSFGSELANAMGTTTDVSDPLGTSSATSGATLPGAASTMLTSDQQQFASRLAGDTGLDPGVVSAWLLAEESGGAAVSRQSANNNDWLNIGYTDGGTYGSSDSVWSNPVTAADATAGWLKGQDTIPGYGTASSGIQSILSTVGQSPSAQIAALQSSGWASSGYTDLPSLYEQVAA